MNFKIYYLFLVLIQLSYHNAKTTLVQKTLMHNIKTQLELYMKYLNKIKESKLETADNVMKTKLKSQLVKELLMEKEKYASEIIKIQKLIEDTILNQAKPQIKQKNYKINSRIPFKWG